VVGGQGLVNGDTLSGALATSATITSNVGAYAITQGSLAPSNNYVLTYVGATLTIVPRSNPWKPGPSKWGVVSDLVERNPPPGILPQR
jgi:hypothetical protein